MDIISGIYKSGDKIPPVRELAATAAVNPNTMQKALAELERKGLVYSLRTSGRYITDDIRKIEELKTQLAIAQTNEFLEKMQGLGFGYKEVISLVEAGYNTE